MIQFQDYDRITDQIFYLSENLSLNFTTVLSRKDRTGARMFFHYETEYQSKYIGTDIARSIKRIMNFYFTIDNKNDFGNGFILRTNDVLIFCMIIEQQLLPLYFDSVKRIYKVIDDRLVIKGEYKDIMYAQSDYKFISLAPIVCTYEDGTYKEGVRMTVNNESEYVDLDIDKFMGFYYLLKKTDMYSVAANMVTYVKQQPYGTNIFSRKGLGGGAPLPDWNEDFNTNNKGNKGNNFLNQIKERRQ